MCTKIGQGDNFSVRTDHRPWGENAAANCIVAAFSPRGAGWVWAGKQRWAGWMGDRGQSRGVT